jgi:hypothetical protein
MVFKTNAEVFLLKKKKIFQERYQSGDAPWDIGWPDFNLLSAVMNNPIQGSKAFADAHGQRR